MCGNIQLWVWRKGINVIFLINQILIESLGFVYLYLPWILPNGRGTLSAYHRSRVLGWVRAELPLAVSSHPVSPSTSQACQKTLSTSSIGSLVWDDGVDGLLWLLDGCNVVILAVSFEFGDLHSVLCWVKYSLCFSWTSSITHTRTHRGVHFSVCRVSTGRHRRGWGEDGTRLVHSVLCSGISSARLSQKLAHRDFTKLKIYFLKVVVFV
jgi:hypothetical protein